MELVNNPEWEKNLNALLEKLLTEVELETILNQGHRQRLKEITKALESGKELNKSLQIIWRACYFDAVCMWTDNMNTFPGDARLSSETREYAQSLRGILFEGIERMNRSGLVPKDDFQESLRVFVAFIDSGVASPEQQLPIYRYLAHVAIALAERIRPSVAMK